MATDKSAPALPKVGEVWVEMYRRHACAVVTELGIFGGKIRVQWRSLGCDVTPREWTRGQFNTFTKRAVRVDDKERGR